MKFFPAELALLAFLAASSPEMKGQSPTSQPAPALAPAAQAVPAFEGRHKNGALKHLGVGGTVRCHLDAELRAQVGDDRRRSADGE